MLKTGVYFHIKIKLNCPIPEKTTELEIQRQTVKESPRLGVFYIFKIGIHTQFYSKTFKFEVVTEF